MASIGSSQDKSLAGLDFVAMGSSLIRVVTQMRTLHNSALPVIRLPPEVLQIVFKMLQDRWRCVPAVELNLGPERTYDKEPFGPPDDVYRPLRAWIAVTHVCRYWRIAALSCSPLWATISLDQRHRNDYVESSLLQASLSRSHNQLLSVRIAPPGSIFGDQRPALELLSQLHRTKELFLLDTPHLEVLHMLLTRSAPKLRTLGVYRDMTSSHSGNGTSRLPALFQGDTSSIQFLAIHCSIHVFLFNRFGNLRQLYLGHQTYVHREDFRSLLEVLDTNTSLEDLMFDSVRLKDSVIFGATIMRANLCSLRKLSFQYLNTRNVDHILSSMRLSAEVALHIIAELGEPLPNLHDGVRIDSSQGMRALKLDLCNAFCDIMGVSLPFTWLVVALDILRFATTAGLGVELAPFMDTVEELWINNELDEDGDDDDDDKDVSDVRTRYSPFFQQLFSPAPLVKKVVMQAAENWVDKALMQALAVSDNLPKLEKIDIHATAEFPFDALVGVLKGRREGGSPIHIVDIYILTRDYKRGEIRMVFDDWMRQARTEVAPLVQKINFVKVIRYPDIEVPSVCEFHERGRWAWPSW